MQENKSQKVLRHFNVIAPKYDVMNTLLSFGLHHWWKRAAITMAALHYGDVVLDVCGGTADLAISTTAIVGNNGGVFVYDFSMEMIKAGKSKTEKVSSAPGIRFICGDAEQIAAHSNIFDAVLIGFGLRNLSDIRKGLKELYRVVKPGGKLMCLEFSRPTFAPFRWLYTIYSFCVMPLAGRLIAGSSEAYTYLPESIRSFPLPQELSSMMQQAGFVQVTFKRLSNGIAAIHVGIKK